MADSAGKVASPNRRRYPELADREWLHRRYVVEGTGPVILARELGCTPPAVVSALARHGIPVRGGYGPEPQLADVLDDEITRVYVETGSVERCAAHFGVTRVTVWRRLVLAGVDVKGHRLAHVRSTMTAKKRAARDALPQELRDADWLRGQLAAGASVRGVSLTTGVPVWMVREAMLKAGVSLSEVRRERNATIVRLAGEGVRGVQIAAMLGIDPGTVSRVLSAGRATR